MRMSDGIGDHRPLGRLTVTAAVICAGLLVWAGTASAADPAVFDVGAASVNINPDTPQYISGYGYKGGPTTDVHDPLEVRAFVVSNGTDAAAFVVADLTGWFSAYQGNLEPLRHHPRPRGRGRGARGGRPHRRPRVGDRLLHPYPRRSRDDGDLGQDRPGLHGEVRATRRSRPSSTPQPT